MSERDNKNLEQGAVGEIVLGRPGNRRPRLAKKKQFSREELFIPMKQFFSLLGELGDYEHSDLEEIRRDILLTLEEMKHLSQSTCEADVSMEEFLEFLLSYIEEQRQD